MNDLSLRCACGAVEGTITRRAPDRTQRALCYCDDCQRFARWIASQSGPDVLDAWGGTDIVQVWPSQITVHAGIDRLRLLQLREGGLFRWFTECCHTPAGNMIGSKRSPFVGVPAVFIRDVDAHCRAPDAYIQGRFAIGAPPPRVHKRAPASFMLRSLRFIGQSALTGQWKRSPFFVDGQLRVAPRVLSASELSATAP